MEGKTRKTRHFVLDLAESQHPAFLQRRSLNYVWICRVAQPLVTIVCAIYAECAVHAFFGRAGSDAADTCFSSAQTVLRMRSWAPTVLLTPASQSLGHAPSMSEMAILLQAMIQDRSTPRNTSGGKSLELLLPRRMLCVKQ